MGRTPPGEAIEGRRRARGEQQQPQEVNKTRDRREDKRGAEELKSNTNTPLSLPRPSLTHREERKTRQGECKGDKIRQHTGEKITILRQDTYTARKIMRDKLKAT